MASILNWCCTALAALCGSSCLHSQPRLAFRSDRPPPACGPIWCRRVSATQSALAVLHSSSSCDDPHSFVVHAQLRSSTCYVFSNELGLRMYLAAGKKYQVKANTKGCGKTGAGHAKSIINVKAGKK